MEYPELNEKDKEIIRDAFPFINVRGEDYVYGRMIENGMSELTAKQLMAYEINHKNKQQRLIAIGKIGIGLLITGAFVGLFVHAHYSNMVIKLGFGYILVAGFGGGTLLWGVAQLMMSLRNKYR